VPRLKPLTGFELGYGGAIGDGCLEHALDELLESITDLNAFVKMPRQFFGVKDLIFRLEWHSAASQEEKRYAQLPNVAGLDPAHTLGENHLRS
jgi:hypothetical protein